MSNIVLAFCVAQSFLLVVGQTCNSQATRPGGKGAEAADLISVEETVELATRQYDDSIPTEDWRRMERGNPAARPELYRILGDPARGESWHGVAEAIGRVGSEEDVPRLLEVLAGLRGTLPPQHNGIVWGVRNALDGMRRRGVPGAREAVLEMCLPAFWEEMRFDTYEPGRRPPGYFTFANEQAYHTVVMPREDDIGLTRAELVERLLARVPDRGQRKVILEYANHPRQIVDPRPWLDATPGTRPAAGDPP